MRHIIGCSKSLLLGRSLITSIVRLVFGRSCPQSGASGTEFAVHPLRNSCDPSRFHRDMVDRIVPLPDLDKYVTIRFDLTHPTCDLDAYIFASFFCAVMDRLFSLLFIHSRCIRVAVFHIGSFSRDGTFSVWAGGLGTFLRTMSPFGATVASAATGGSSASSSSAASFAASLSSAKHSSIAASLSAAAGTGAAGASVSGAGCVECEADPIRDVNSTRGHLLFILLMYFFMFSHPVQRIGGRLVGAVDD